MTTSLNVIIEELRRSKAIFDPQELVTTMQAIVEKGGADADRDLKVFIVLDNLFGTDITNRFMYLLRMAARHGRVKAYQILRDQAFAAFSVVAKQRGAELRKFTRDYIVTLLQLANEAVKAERVIRQERSYSALTIPTLGGEEEE